MTQPEALFLADVLETFHNPHDKQAAAELRRLYEKCEALTADTIEEMRRINEIYELTAQRDALLEACKTLVTLPGTEDWAATLRLAVEQARAAIAKAEENT